MIVQCRILVWVQMLLLFLPPDVLPSQASLEHQKLPLQLEVLELREVLREEDPSGRNHYIKVVLAEHDIIQDVVSWNLAFISSIANIPNTIVYTMPDNYESPVEQNEILFEGNVVSAELLILTARDSVDSVLAVFSKTVEINDLGTRVAWIGEQPSYLRVHTGTLESVYVTSEVVCFKEDSPCYFPQQDDQPLPSEVQRCINVTATDNSSFLQCDDVISQYQEMTEDPELLLQDLKTLEITGISSALVLEVVLASVDDGSILEVLPCPETEEGKGTCNVITDLTNRREVYNLLVLLDDTGYVEESKIILFAVYKIKVKQLREDALCVVWGDGNSDNYIVSVNTTDLDVMVDCLLPDDEADAGMCQAHIISPDLARDSSVVVSVRKALGKNTVAVNEVFTDDFPEASTVSRMMQVVEDGATATIVRVRAVVEDIITAGLVRHPGIPPTTTIIEEYYVGDVNHTDDNYIFKFSKDVLKPGESSKFLTIGYKKDGNVGIVGAAFVTPKVIDVNLARVGNTEGPLRVATSNEYSLIIADNPDWTCSSDASPCFLPEALVLPDQVPVCLPLDNAASEDNTQVLQCQLNPVTPFQAVSTAKLTLSEHTKLQVDASYSSNTIIVEVEVVSDSPILSEHCGPFSPCQFECISFPSVFHVLLVGLGVNNMVVESTLIPFQDLNVTARQLMKDILEVWWSSPIQETYTVTIRPATPSPKDSEAIAPTRVTCSPETLSCKAHFMSLPARSYTILVQKEGDDTAVVAENTQIDSSFLPPSVSEIIRVIRISETTTGVSLKAPLEGNPTVQLSVVIEGDEIQEVSSEAGQMDSHSLATYQFSHQDPVFITRVTTKFLLVARQAENLVSVGQAYLTLQDLDDSIAWVGAQAEETSASLRVDSVSIPDLSTDSMVCLENSTICYYLEVGGKMQSLVWCREVSNTAPEGPDTIEQCDEEITDFMGFSIMPVVQIEGDVLKVGLEASSSRNSFEVLAYDRDDTSTLYSSPQHCDINSTTHICTQAVKIPRGRSQMKVLVVELGEDKAVNESAVIFVLPSHGTEVWVIILSAFGFIFVIALISYAIIITAKKMKPYHEGIRNRGYMESPAEGVIRAPMPGEEKYDEWGSRRLGHFPPNTLRYPYTVS
ncbi:uncharacterized protein [Panulirus ornatus]|uniref:uncharacterized protein isoform X2 n=1 Tax=Panulirus ornatus TaxID=150431 RepID=UPI003A8377C7